MTTAPLFIYGTLQHEDVRSAVLGHDGDDHHFVPATLPDHAVYHVAGTAYPMIVAEPGAVAHGLLWYGLSAADYQRLDRFEGAHYQRHPVQIMPAEGADIIIAELYQPDLILPQGDRWDYRHWTVSGLSQFLEVDFDLDGVRSPSLQNH